MAARKVQLELVPPPIVEVDFPTVGLDLSLSGTGIVVIDPDAAVVLQRTVGYDLSDVHDERAQIERYLYIVSEIVEAVRACIDRVPARPRVVIEEYAFAKKYSTSVTKLAELRGCVKTQLWLAFQLVPDIVTVGEARRVVLGKGNYPKGEVRGALARRGLVFGTADTADAYVVAEALRRRVARLKG